MREPKEVKGLRLSPAALIAIAGGEPPKLDQSSFLGMPLQAKLGKSLLEIHEELLGLVAMLEPRNEVIGIAHDDDLSVHLLLSPLPNPQIEHVV
jgi:hypothetical protein